MHYYTFHPKDYISKTHFLDPIEDIAYRRMLDYIYLNECHLPSDIEDIAKKINMRTHTDSIANVLRDFFDLTDDGYMNDRAEQEIAKYQEKSDKAKKSANARWNKKGAKSNKSKASSERNANALPTQSDSNANHKPLTTNHEPLTNSNDDGEKALNIPFDVFWKTYAKSAAKDKCEAKWSSLSNTVREQVMQHLPAYVTSTPVKKFRKDPYTYLNGKGWLDDIITDEPRANQQATAYSSMSVNAKYDDPNHDTLGGLGNRTGAHNGSH